MYLAKSASMHPSAMESVLTRLLGSNVTSLKKIRGGRNSQTYRLTCEGGGVYAAKFYFRQSPDDHDRLGAEFSGLEFLWENSVRCIPRPIAVDRSASCAVYEYIDGSKITSKEVTPADIECAIDFLARLRRLTSKRGSNSLPPASEACFSIKAIIDNISQRLDRLSALRNGGAQYDALHKFLTDDFKPSFEEVIKWCRSSLNQSGILFDAELSYNERTLSPSDFGFHNALRRADGDIVFLDFEYFGWDDPAKMISDFLLHPAMRLRESLRRQFALSILDRFKDLKFLDRRVVIVYPLFGLKWCLILLNEFVPELLARRGFAVNKELNNDRLQVRQLAKARRILNRVLNEYEHFPYRA